MVGNTGRLLAFPPTAAVLLLPRWGHDVCPGKKYVLHLCASWLGPHTGHSNCDGTDLPNKHFNVLNEQYVRLSACRSQTQKADQIPRRIQNTPILHGYCPYEQLAIPNPYSLYYNVSNGTQFQRHQQLLAKSNL